jgi:ubiquinone/menaquinone biosynthesis C-methylase UbiE
VNHSDHVNLLRNGISTKGGVWADLGSGSGAFTLALADLIGPTGEIYSVDRDDGALREQERAMRARFPEVTVHYLNADFTRPLDLPPLDGIVTANALHFHREKDPILKLLLTYLKPGGHFIVIEYDTDQGNTWVPYPFSFETWKTMSVKNGFGDTHLIGSVPSRFLREMYSALSKKPSQAA